MNYETKVTHVGVNNYCKFVTFISAVSCIHDHHGFYDHFGRVP